DHRAEQRPAGSPIGAIASAVAGVAHRGGVVGAAKDIGAVESLVGAIAVEGVILGPCALIGGAVGRVVVDVVLVDVSLRRIGVAAGVVVLHAAGVVGVVVAGVAVVVG